MSVVRLDEHVMGEILCFCDVQGVLRVSQVNKYCQHIAFSKYVWISLIRDLEFRGLRDRDPQLQLDAYTTQALVDMAKSVVLGPRTWSPASAVPPTLSREIVVSLDKSFGPTEDAAVNLLPGGTHFTMYAGLRSFSLGVVATRRRIWRYETPHWLPSSVEVKDGGEVAVFAFRTAGQPGYIEVIEINLLTEESLMALRLPSYPAHAFLDLSGDFLLPTSSYREAINEVQVINWRENTRIRLVFSTNVIDAAAAAIVGNYLIVVHRADQSLQLVVYALDSLSWPSALSSPPATTHIPAASLILPFANVGGITRSQVTAHKHPTRRDAHLVMLDVFQSQMPPTSAARSRSFCGLWSRIRGRKQPVVADNIWRIRYTLSLTSSQAKGAGSVPAPTLALNSTTPNFDQRVQTLSRYYIKVHGRHDAGSSSDCVVLYEGCPGRDESCIRDRSKRETRPRRVMQWPRRNPVSSPWPSLGLYSSAVLLMEERLMRILYYQ
ncbi:hypothetical protein FB45DRAFT_933023 [Roridomyces roridus]|uniref:F-box domain-containing protein n=1 Tax=Roridomyces roridus TaxID=1738132 RepID=A0AAD7BDE5_9AGAR|nr:hypothetical protein FB45DRAFT_933023 [Roridomyces roridus]